MEIQQIEQETNGYFRAVETGLEAGKMTYSRAGADKIIINSTTVNPEFKGKGVGKELVMFAVNYARENNIRIMPLCPFAKSVFDKTEAIKDVLWK